jgi:hypothetical protein
MPSQKKSKEREITENALFGSVHQERGDFLLPQIVDYIESKKWIDPRPPYQRRLVWGAKEKSKFLESLLLNLPIPPLFLFEKSYGLWEIMDGQQRSNAIVEFYSGKLKLSSLKRWPSLNGKTYSECPEDVRRNFDRRRIQVTTVLAETSHDPSFDVRKEVFERLNTGGKPLRSQEIRNCLYAGEFCDLLDELSSLPEFTALWQIPAHKPPRLLKSFPPQLLDNMLFARMEDCELVLRFFAFESSKFFSGSIKGALDNCMAHYSREPAGILQELRDRFRITISLVFAVFGADAILIENGSGKKTPSKQLYDAIMAGVAGQVKKGDALMKKRKQLQKALRTMLGDKDQRDKLVTRHDNRDTFNNRKDAIAKLLHLENELFEDAKVRVRRA